MRRYSPVANDDALLQGLPSAWKGAWRATFYGMPRDGRVQSVPGRSVTICKLQVPIARQMQAPGSFPTNGSRQNNQFTELEPAGVNRRSGYGDGDQMNKCQDKTPILDVKPTAAHDRAAPRK